MFIACGYMRRSRTEVVDAYRKGNWRRRRIRTPARLLTVLWFSNSPRRESSGSSLLIGSLPRQHFLDAVKKVPGITIPVDVAVHLTQEGRWKLFGS